MPQREAGLDPLEAAWVMRAFASLRILHDESGDTAQSRFALCALLLAEIMTSEQDRWDGLLPFLRSADRLVAEAMHTTGKAEA